MLGRWKIHSTVSYEGVVYKVCVALDAHTKPANSFATSIVRQVMKGVVVLVRPEELTS